MQRNGSFAEAGKAGDGLGLLASGDTKLLLRTQAGRARFTLLRQHCAERIFVAAPVMSKMPVAHRAESKRQTRGFSECALVILVDLRAGKAVQYGFVRIGIHDYAAAKMGAWTLRPWVSSPRTVSNRRLRDGKGLSMKCEPSRRRRCIGFPDIKRTCMSARPI